MTRACLAPGGGAERLSTVEADLIEDFLGLKSLPEPPSAILRAEPPVTLGQARAAEATQRPRLARPPGPGRKAPQPVDAVETVLVENSTATRRKLGRAASTLEACVEGEGHGFAP